MRSEGSRLLGAVEMTQAQIALRIGVSRATVAHWITGRHIPIPEHRKAMRTAFKIPYEAWPDEWVLVRDTIVRTLAAKAPHLLEEIVTELERVAVKVR